MRTSRHPALAVLALGTLLPLVAACGGDDSSGDGGDGGGRSGTTLPATECAGGEAEPGRTITLSIDDVVGGFGAISSQTPSGLTAGQVRITVEADAENEGPVDVVVTGPDGVAATIAGVEAGVTCGIDVELAAGDYVATSNRNPDTDAEFTIVP